MVNLGQRRLAPEKLALQVDRAVELLLILLTRQAQGVPNLPAGLDKWGGAGRLTQKVVKVAVFALEAGDQRKEELGQLRIEMGAARGQNLRGRSLKRPRRFVRTLMRQGVKHVRQRRNPSRQRDLGAQFWLGNLCRPNVRGGGGRSLRPF